VALDAQLIIINLVIPQFVNLFIDYPVNIH